VDGGVVAPSPVWAPAAAPSPPPALQLVVVGASQQSAPLAVRERLAIAPADARAALAELRDTTSAALALSTCNRVEVYALTAEGDPGPAQRFLAARAGLAPEALAPYLYVRRGEAAARHLCAVAAGLDSMVLGEDQILAQIKAALEAARAAGALGPVLDRLGQTALLASKQVRSRTSLARRPLSVVAVALQVAATHSGDLAGRTALIVGAGATAELTLKHLAGRGLARRVVVNRTAARAEALAARHGAEALPWERLPDALAEADVVISCTAAAAPVIDARMLGAALARRPDRRLLVLDLAAPRDVEPAPLPGVTYYDLDRIQPLCEANRAERAGAVGEAEAIVGAAAAQFMAWWRERAAAPAVAALRAEAEAIREAEVARALAALPDLTEQERAVVAYLGTALVNKLLHGPLLALKQQARTRPDPH
jgi:glutamyl-tRNA reductase